MKEIRKDYFSRFLDKEVKTEPHVIKFYSETCHLCVDLQEVFKKLTNDLSNDYKFVKVDIHKEEKLADLFSSDGVPTIIVYEGGNFHEIKYPEKGYSYEYLKEILTKGN
mgnify:CR=1 FL=1|tara:strand:- start:326 stop:652 length:327 start_codon:yes stop_codon:yes gene_type:complete